MKTLAVSVLLCAMVVLSSATARRSLVRRSRGCPAGWTRIQNRCYRFVPIAHSWSKSEKNCLTMGGHLASVHNADQYHAIQRMITEITHGFPNAWLGGTDCQEEGTWLWTDGTAFDYRHCGTFNNGWWNQHCLQMNYGDHKCWDDLKCSTKLPSVCARNLI
ncbi:ladderlectin-like [Trachinotus anak]|uniref:ladderlectin-like n=1 Tax=Trachinotus anak TaxID=443729 RepID=UPI0039F225FA